MAINQGLRDAFQSMFLDRYYSRSIYAHTFLNDCIFNHYMEVCFKELNHIEYPLWIRDNVEDRLTIGKRYSSICSPLEKEIIPLYCKKDLGIIKTAESMLKRFFNTGRSNDLYKAINGNDVIYYGGRGLILDANFNILACLYLTADWNDVSKRWEYGNSILKVSNKVFENQQEFMSKAIIQKFIPLCLELYAIEGYTSYFRATELKKSQIVIEDCSFVIVKPIKPSPNNCTNEKLNQVLVDNIDEIISLVK